LRRLVRLLRSRGRVFASSPNVSHHSVIRQLLRGRWQLEDSGIMDRTHLRWFTPSTFRALFEDAGIIVDHVGPVVPPTAKARLINAVTGGALAHLFIMQINLHGHRAP